MTYQLNLVGHYCLLQPLPLENISATRQAISQAAAAWPLITEFLLKTNASENTTSSKNHQNYNFNFITAERFSGIKEVQKQA